MLYSCDLAVSAVLGQSVSVSTTRTDGTRGLVVSLCTMVCEWSMMSVCLSHVGYSAYFSLSVPDKFWRFTTSTRVWERVNSTVTNAVATMTSVGLDLWVVGCEGDSYTTASGEGDTYTTRRTTAGVVLRKRVCLVSPDDSRTVGARVL